MNYEGNQWQSNPEEYVHGLAARGVQAQDQYFRMLGIFFFRKSAKTMAGDNALRLLLEKMTQCACSAYLGILGRRASLRTMIPNIGDNVTTSRMEFQASLQMRLGQY